MANSSPELERAVLLRGITDPAWFLDASLAEDLFAAPSHQAVLRALAAVVADGGHPDRVTLRAALGAAASGPSGDILDSILTGTYSDADTPVEKLRNLAECRRLHNAYLQGAARAQEGDLVAAQDAMASLLAEPTITRGRSSYDGRQQAQYLRDHLDRPGEMGVHAGCPLIADLVGDLHPGHELVIGADTNVGKSSVALGIVEGLARRGVRTVTVSLEDDPLVFVSRRVAARSRVSSRLIVTRRYQPEERAVLDDAIDAIGAEDHVQYVHLPGGTVGEVALAMTRAARAGARLAVVDYLQAVGSSVRAQDRRNEIREINTTLKATAAKLGIPLVMCSQLRRGQVGDKPTKHDLKEAGDIENAAEFVVLLWREAEEDSAPINVWLAKSKIGGIGTEARYERERGSGILRPGEDL